MAKQKYEYDVNDAGAVSNTKLDDDEFSREDDSYVKEIELEDTIFVEARPIVKTTIEVYATAKWTDGKEAQFRISVPVEYVAGNEDAILEQAFQSAMERVIEGGEGFDRLAEFEFSKEVSFPEDSTYFEEIEKPVFERQFTEQGVVERERQPTGFEVAGRTIGRTARNVVRVIGSVIEGAGKFLGRIGKMLRGFR